MSHTIDYDPEDRILILNFLGSIGLKELKQAFSDVLTMAMGIGASLFLIEFLDAVLDLEVDDIYHLPEVFMQMPALHGQKMHTFKRAIVVSQAGLSSVLFKGDLDLQAGHTIKIFQDRNEARSWLLEPEA